MPTTASRRAASAVNAAWSYEHPYAPVAEIKGYIAFYPNRVDASG